MGALLGGSSGSAPERYAGIQVSTSLAGQVMPMVYGRNRVPMNLIDYGNFKSTPSSSGGKGGSAPSSFTYSAYFIASLSIGPIQGVITTFNEKSITSLTYENLALALGATGQATWSGYPAGTPTQNKIPYSNQAYVASQDYDFGGSASMPNLTFEIEGLVPGFSDAHGMYDADPAAVVSDYLTNSIHGAGFTGTIATLTGTSNTYQAYCGSLGLYTSPYENNQRSATDFMQELMQITNSDLVLSCGTLKVIPYADTAVSGTTPDGTNWSYAPNLTPVYNFTDSDYCPQSGSEPVILTRKALTDTFNIVNIQYNDRADFYNQAPAGAQDNWDISIRGPRCMSTLSFQQITTAAVAKTAAQLILQFQLYERNTYTFRVRADYWLLEPMDYVGITDSGLGLVNQLVRITEIQDDKDNFLTIKAMEIPGTVRNTPQYNWNASQGYFANFGAVPPSVSTPDIFQMPAIPASLSQGITLGMSVCGPTSSTNWGGCQVYMSADGGNTYQWVGTIGSNGAGLQGTTGALAVVADPDTSSTLTVTLTNTNLQLSTAATHADADAMLNLALLDTGTSTEVISYGSCALVSAGVYNLTYLRRGQYGTIPATHSSGARFVNIDGTVFQIPIDPGYAGKTLNFKFLSFNSVGLQTQTQSAATAYSYVVPVANSVSGVAALIPRGACAISGQTVYAPQTKSVGWNADAYTGAAYASISISGQYNGITAGGAQGIGLTTVIPGSPSIDPGAAATGFIGFYPHPDSGNTLAVINGANQWVGPNPSKNDLYQVTYDGFTIRWYFNGALVATYQAQGLLLFGYVTFFYGGFAFSNVETTVGALATPSQFVATGNAVVNDTNAMKQGGTNNWDCAVYSVIGYQTCHITAKVNSLTLHEIIALSTTPVPTAANVAASTVNTQSGYAVYNNGGTWQITTNGTVITTLSAVALSDTVAVTYDGSTVTFWLNGISVGSPVSVSGVTMYGMVTLYDVNSGVNSLRFGPTTNLSLPVTGGAALLTARGSCVLNGQMVSKPAGSNAWDGDAVSSQAFAAGAIQAQNKGGGAGVMALGLIASIPGSPTTVPDSGAGNGYYGIYVHGGGTNVLAVVENGVVVVSSTPAANDLYLVTYDGFSIRYYINNGLVWTTTRQLGVLYFITSFFSPTTSAALVDLQITTSAQSTPSQFVATGNCTVNDTNAFKQGGTAAWDSAVYSITGYLTCHITAKVNAVGTNINRVMIGLATQPVPTAANVSGGNVYIQASYALFNDGSGNWQIFQSGSLIATLGAPSITDVATVTYDGSTVTYWLNGISVGTPVSVSGLTLYGFCPFFDSGGGLNSLRFGPTTNLAVTDTAQINGSAVTQPAASQRTSSLVLGSLSAMCPDVTVVVPTGQTWPVSVQAVANIQQAAGSSGAVELFEDGTQVLVTKGWGSGVIGVRMDLSYTFTDTLAAGSHTFSFRGASFSASDTCLSASLAVTFLKR